MRVHIHMCVRVRVRVEQATKNVKSFYKIFQQKNFRQKLFDFEIKQ